MMNDVNVRENIGVVNANIPGSTFFSPQKVDADAAYQRLSITRKALKMYQREINNTNTVDVVGELRSLYIDLETTMKLIMLAEQQLIHEGE